MLNNHNNEIYTDYRANDIFKPVNANQLAEAIHYDFVITQEKIDAVLEAIAPTPDGSGYRNLDLGELIIRKVDGESAPWNGNVVKPPLNIFISGKLPSDVRLILDSRFLGDTMFIDCSDFKSSGSWSMTTTKDMINIYSAYPYAVSNLPGGFNFWSTPQAPLIYTNGVSNNGVIKLGAYKTTPGATTDFSGRQGGQVIAQDCYGGSVLRCDPGSYYDSYVPFVVYANWMQCGGVVANYSIVSQSPGGSLTPTTSKPGLFQQMRETIATWNCEISLIVAQSYASSRYQFCGWDSDEIRFSNLDEGKIVTIHKNGAVTWKTAAVGSSGGSSKVVISDFDITNIPLLFKNGTAEKYAKSLKSNGSNPNSDWDWARTLVLRNGMDYITVAQDCPNYGGVLSWYFNDSRTSFKFQGATELDLYKWGAVFAPNSEDIGWGTTMTDENCGWWTAKSSNIYIDYNDLQEGVVYTVRVHTMILPFGNMAPQTGTTSYKLFEQDRTGEHTQSSVYFCDNTAIVTPLYWGSDGKGVSGNPSNVFMNAVKQTTVHTSDSSSNGGNALEETNRAELIFVKLNGSVYVMKY